MAFVITSIRKISEKGSIKDGRRDYVTEFQVKFTGVYSTAALLAAGGTTVSSVTLPAAQSTHPDDEGVYASGIDVGLEDDSSPLGTSDVPGVAKYAVTYTSNGFEQFSVAPLARPPVIAWRGSDRTQVSRFDANDQPLVNSAGDFYDPLPEYPIQGGECSITFNTATNPATWCTTLSNTVNSSAFYGVDPGKALIGIIEGTQHRETYLGSEVAYWQVVVPIRFNRNGWRWKPIDNGFKYVNEEDEKQVATDKLGTRTPVPILLDGEGGELEDGEEPIIFPEDGYKIIDEVSWSSLSLPNPFT